jgi:ectoine hydroxylase-related dioxygenase (phytanoyl-CoA dioxygenase family)
MESTREANGASNAAADELARRVVEHGFAILRDVAPPALVAELRETSLSCMDELGVATGSNRFLGHCTRRLFNLLARDARFETVPLFVPVLDVVERVLDRECLLSSLTAVDMGPGEQAQPIHCDDGSIGLPKPHAPITCTAIWALTDFTEENGGTRIVPGSHRSERNPRRGDGTESIATEMSAGSVLIYHGSLWHGGGANRSNTARAAIICNYCAGFLRQEECQLLALPRERVAAMPPRLQRLVGYSTYRGLMGHVDQQDPATFVDPSASTDMVWRKITR